MVSGQLHNDRRRRSKESEDYYPFIVEKDQPVKEPKQEFVRILGREDLSNEAVRKGYATFS